MSRLKPNIINITETEYKIVEESEKEQESDIDAKEK